MTAQPKPREFVLPFPPRGLRRVEAARYVGVSPSTFDWMIGEGIMPKPKRVGARVIWDRHSLDEYFAAIPSDDDAPRRSICDEIA